MNSTKSNSKADHLFPKLPPIRSSAEVGGSAGNGVKWFGRFVALCKWCCVSSVSAAVRLIGQPLLRLPAMEFTVILLLCAVFLFSLA